MQHWTTRTWSRPYWDGLFLHKTRRSGRKEVPSLRGRIVLFIFSRMSRRWCPVPTWTDCSRTLEDAAKSAKVPSLRGWIVLSYFFALIGFSRPVPTWTDCSQEGNQESNQAMSCPYGDGLFRIRHFWKFLFSIPSLRGRIVLILLSWISEWACPVPTGTDCSYFQMNGVAVKRSRPYWDGLFLMASFKYSSTAFS